MKPYYIVASCKEWNRPVFNKQTKRLKGAWKYVSNRRQLLSALKNNNPEYIFFLHWNWLVPPEIWRNVNCVCFHMTDVPYGRGGSPLQNLILTGKKTTKVTALQMVQEPDAGPVYAKRTMSLKGRAEEIYLRAGKIGWAMIRMIIRKNPKAVPQKGKITRFYRRKPEQSLLPSKGSLAGLFDFIRMLDAPTYPLAFLKHGGFQIEFSQVKKSNDLLKAEVSISKIKE